MHARRQGQVAQPRVVYEITYVLLERLRAADGLRLSVARRAGGQLALLEYHLEERIEGVIEDQLGHGRVRGDTCRGRHRSRSRRTGSGAAAARDGRIWGRYLHLVALLACWLASRWRSPILLALSRRFEPQTPNFELKLKLASLLCFELFLAAAVASSC